MTTNARSLSRKRRAAVWTLIVLASLIALVAILATWVNRQVLDDKSWSKTSKQLIQDPTVQSALSVYLVNQLYDNIDVAAALEKRMPADLQPLAAPAAAALRQPATNGVAFLLTRPRIQASFLAASGQAHHQLVAVLENKTGFGIETGNGQVTIDLGAVLKELGPQLGLPASATKQLPADAGVITIMKSNQLGTLQQAVRAIKIASLWLMLLVFAMYASAIYLAAGERRTTLRNVGWAFVVVGLIILVVRRLAGNYAVDSLTLDPYREPAHQIWLISTSILAEVGRAAVLYGSLGVLGAILAGPTTAATAVRRSLAPVLNRRPGIAWGVTGFAYLLLVLWGGTHALRTWWGILLLGGLLAFGVVALRRETLIEFPDAGLEPSQGSFARAVATKGTSLRAKPAPPTRSAADELARLAELHDSGALTDVEFLHAKEIALSNSG